MNPRLTWATFLTAARALATKHRIALTDTDIERFWFTAKRANPADPLVALRDFGIWAGADAFHRSLLFVNSDSSNYNRRAA